MLAKTLGTMRTLCTVVVAGIVLALAGLSYGQETAATQPYLAARLYDELFDTALPGQYKKGEWDLSLQPKMSDFIHDDYVRFLTGVRYSFSNYFDAHARLGTYFANPAKDGTGIGLYQVQFGGRYTWFNFPGDHNNMAFGIDSELPISDPPQELTDRYARTRPYITISHQVNSHAKWVMYLNSMFEVVHNSLSSDDAVTPKPLDRLFLRPGLIYYPGGSFRYSLELEYRTNVLHFRGKEAVPHDYMGPPANAYRPENWILAYEDVHELILEPGITWFPAKKVRDGLWIPGQWDLGVRVEIPVVEETGEDVGVSVRFRWFYDYRKFIREDLPGVFGMK